MTTKQPDLSGRDVGRKPSAARSTLTWMVWWPRAPSGAGGVMSAVWTSPVPSVARTVMRCSPPSAGASQGSTHWTQVASLSGSEICASCHSPPSMATSTRCTPRSGAQATPPMGTVVPPATVALGLGVSMRDWVRMGASLAQLRGIQ